MSDDAFTLDILAGRLLGQRWPHRFEASHLGELGAALGRVMAELEGPLVFVSDLSRTTVVPPDISEKLIVMLKADNPRLEKNAVLVGQSATFSMQIDRWIREAEHPGRMSSRDPQDLLDWLRPSLTHAESKAARKFLMA